jgi:hypothetical protein
VNDKKLTRRKFLQLVAASSGCAMAGMNAFAQDQTTGINRARNIIYDNIGAPLPAPINSYAIHADGGLIYNPLYNMARSTKQLAKYDTMTMAKKTIHMDNFTLTYNVPTNSVGYDVIPVPYNITWTGKAVFPLAVEATAFEEPSRRARSKPV